MTPKASASPLNRFSVFQSAKFNQSRSFCTPKEPENKNAPPAAAPARDEKIMEIVRKQLADIKEAGTYKKERIILSPQRASIEVKDKSEAKKSEVLNFW